MITPEDWANAKRVGGGGRAGRRSAATARARQRQAAGKARISPAIGSWYTTAGEGSIAPGFDMLMRVGQTVGVATGQVGFVSGKFGNLNPQVISGQITTEFSSGNSSFPDLFLWSFNNKRLIDDNGDTVDTITLTLLATQMVLSWSGNQRYEATSVGIRAALLADLGNFVGVMIDSYTVLP